MDRKEKGRVQAASSNSRASNYSFADSAAQFRDAMLEAGLQPPEHIEPGVLHRFPGVGKGPGNRAGWCWLFDDGLGGCFGDWAAGLDETWQARRDKPMSRSECAAHRHQMAKAKAAREDAQRRQRAETRETAGRTWKGTSAVERHPYLDTKGVHSYGIRLTTQPLEIPFSWRDKPQFIPANSLVIPLTDTGGVIHSLQFIDEQGNKRFLAGGAIQGHFFPLGDLSHAETILIAEGFATAATLDMVTDHTAVAAFNAGNLKPVAVNLKAAYPRAEFIICADNDRFTDDNPGITKAREAAVAIGAKLAIPKF
ncbi:MAG TPA: toprim domain-containing protein, partial [Thiolapillus brandeum]|nr:toprim domain-containing protein [Thiolapillus brandeum]